MHDSMDAMSSAALSAMAANTTVRDPASVLVLKAALDQNANAMATLLQSSPQKDGAGQIVDVLA